MSQLLTREQMLANMDQALADEIAYQSKYPKSTHTAINGQLISDENTQFIYKFSLEDPWDAQDDTPLTISNSSAKGIKCTVISSTGNELTITTDKQLPPDVLYKINLCDDSVELLRRQREALKQIDEGEPQLASKCFGLQPYVHHTDNSQLNLNPTRPPRSAQETAIRMSLGGEVTYIVGPPGTGKTFTLAAIAFKHLQEGRTVLIAAHTNIAIDNAIMALNDLCLEVNRTDLLTQGQVIRYGAVQKEQLKHDKKYANVYLPALAKRLGNELHQQQEQCKLTLTHTKNKLSTLITQQTQNLQSLEQERTQLSQQLQTIRQTIQTIETQEQQRIKSIRTQIDNYQHPLTRLQRLHTDLQQKLAQHKAQHVEQTFSLTQQERQEQLLLTQLVQARKMSSFTRFFRGIKIPKLEAQVAQCSQSIYTLKQTIQTIEQTTEQLHQQISHTSQEQLRLEAAIRPLESQLATLPSVTNQLTQAKDQQTRISQQLSQVDTTLNQRRVTHQHDLKALEQGQKQLEEQLTALDKQLRDLESNLVSNALVIGTTLTKTFSNKTIAEKRFTAVILDEVSMAPPPLVYIAASHAQQSVTLIGDPQQLAPIVSAQTPIAKEWLGKDVFDRCNISLQAANQHIRHSVLLDFQSRMHPQISNLANQLVYKGTLKDAYDRNKQKQTLPLPNSPLVLCNTEDASPIASRPTNGKSRKNYYHAQCSLSLVRQLLTTYPELKQSEPAIGIITPYAPQAKQLQKMLKEAGFTQFVKAGTVHRFQGLEFDVVIYDTLESYGLDLGSFTSQGYGSNSMRLFNVALTRARHKLIIIANKKFIQTQFPETSTVRQAIQLIPATSTICSLEIVGTSLPKIIQSTLQKHPQLTNATPATLLNHIDLDTDCLVLTSASSEKHLTEQTFYAIFEKDLKTAHKSVTITSPFITTKRVHQLLPLFKTLQKKQVAIKIWTKPTTEHKESWHREGIQLLTNAGIDVGYIPKMHQKIAAIDDTILYHGSLNILSQSDSLEGMIRLIGANQLMQDALEALQAPTASEGKKQTTHQPDWDKLTAIQISVKKISSPSSTCSCGSNLVARFSPNQSAAFFGCINFKDNQTTHTPSERVSLHHLKNIADIKTQTCKKCTGPLTLQFEDRPQRAWLTCTPECGEIQRIEFTR